MFDPVATGLFIGFVLVCAALCWLTFLHVLLFRRTRALEQDNYRLIRRLGQYYSLSLGVPEVDIPQPAMASDSDSPLPHYFRFKPSPIPPPHHGSTPTRKADL